MRVKRILKYFCLKDLVNNHPLNHLAKSSLDVQENDIFIAIGDGHGFIDEAIFKGAKTILHEMDCDKKEGINYIKVKSGKVALGILANRYYHEITRKVHLIGVTGTNGKTTVSTLLFQFLEYQNKKSLFIGTSGIQIGENIYETKNTTPDILITLAYIYEAYKKGVRYVLMEVSSQAIDNLRTYGFDFNVAIFTNLNHEHLDYHKTMERYRNCKGLFLHSVNPSKKNLVIINEDDPEFMYFYQVSRAKTLTYGIEHDSQYRAINIKKTMDNGTSFKLITPNGKYSLKTFLIGEFNIKNILASIACLNHLGFPISEIESFLKIYQTINGRMEMLKYDGLSFIIDYAHTPYSVKSCLESIKDYSRNRIIAIVGCGGNRDKEKRPLIGKYATELSDYVIFTNDNPRDESDETIMNDILNGVKEENYEIIYERGEAIKRAIQIAKENDIIVVLGKGSESYQIIHNIKYPFNDKEFIKKIMKERN